MIKLTKEERKILKAVTDDTLTSIFWSDRVLRVIDEILKKLNKEIENENK